MRVFLKVSAQLLIVTSWLLQAAAGQAEPVPTQLDLKTAIELLRKNNPSLLRDQRSIAVAQSELRTARQIPNPALDVSSESYPAFEDRGGPFFNNQELVLRGSQTIETAGKRRKRAAVATSNVAVVENEVSNTRRSLELELKGRFFAALLAQQQLEVARQVASQFDAIVRVNAERYKQGEVSGLEYARIQAERSRFFNDLVEAELAVSNAKAAVAELIGLAPDAVFEPKGTLAAAPLRIPVPDLIRAAQQNRADFLAQQQRVQRENKDLDLQRALAIPNVTPSFGYKRDFGANTVAFGVNLPLPIFNRNQGGISRALAQFQAQQFELQRVALRIGREVQQASNAVNAHQRRVAALRDMFLPNAARARQIAQESYRLGAIDLVGLLDTERSYREIIRAYNQALFDQRIAAAELEAAIGKDLLNE